jgi:restriction system protein
MNKDELLDKFTKYFENGYKFEEFCKVFLNWLNFDDVKVTKRSGDAGIDLTCSKEEIDGLELNAINYVVQAKRFSKSNKVGSKEIRDLKGTSTNNSTRKLFITTSDYTPDAIKEANDNNNLVTLINGDKIIEYLITLQDKVFDVEYVFSKEKLDDLFVNDDKNNTSNAIERRITKNDVRARILRFPSEYKSMLIDKNKFQLSINGSQIKYFTISSDKTYFGGVTLFYKPFISNLDFQEAKSVWNYDPEKNVIYVTIK